MIISGTKGWSKNQDSDTLGILRATMGLDLTTNKPHVRVSPRMKTGTDDITNLGVAVGFERFNLGGGHSGFVTIAGDRFFDSSTEDASAVFAPSAASLTSFSSDTADIMFFRKANKLVGSAQATLQWHDGSIFANGGSLTSGTVHMMTQYGLLGYVTDAFKSIGFFTTALAYTAPGSIASPVANTFTLDTYSSNNVGLFISKILGASNTIWIFTINAALGQVARVFTWDGATANTPTNSQGYILDSGGVWSAVMVNDTPYIINVNGRLQKAESATFVDVPNGRLPFDKNKLLKNAFSSVNDRPVHPNGLIIVPGNRLQVLVNNVYEDGTIDEFFPSGVYEFDLTNTSLGWYHVRGLSLYTSTVTDYAQNRVSRVGGMINAQTPTGDGVILLGAQIYSDASATKEIIAYDDIPDDAVQKYGYLVTSKIYSQNVTETFQKFITRHKKLLDSADSIVVKYRVNDPAPSEVTVTWTDTNTITSTGDLSGYAVGDEMEITQGKGSGKCAHITAISANAGTYTVDLDDTFTGASSGTAKARFQKWKKIERQTSQRLKHFTASPEIKDTWIQFKVCMQFTGKNELDDMMLINKPDQLAK